MLEQPTQQRPHASCSLHHLHSLPPVTLAATTTMDVMLDTTACSSHISAAATIQATSALLSPLREHRPYHHMVDCGLHHLWQIISTTSTSYGVVLLDKVEGEEENNLKYLNFVQIRTLQLVGCLSTVYGYAKDNSGPLKPGVQSLEGTVKTVVSPVYNKYHSVPSDLLKFVDQKVDVSVTEGKRCVPLLVSKAVSAAQKAPEAARSVVAEVQRDGLVGTAKGVAKKAEPVAASAWRRLNSLPLVPKVAEVVVPRVGYCSEKYNEAVCYTVERGYGVGAYLPLVPTKKIAEVFGGEKGHNRLIPVEE